jgi:hypothetical protein
MTKITVKVTARAGRCISGYGSREQGETFELPPEVAEVVSTLDGFEVAKPAKPKTKPAVKAKPEPQEGESNAL